MSPRVGVNSTSASGTADSHRAAPDQGGQWGARRRSRACQNAGSRRSRSLDDHLSVDPGGKPATGQRIAQHRHVSCAGACADANARASPTATTSTEPGSATASARCLLRASSLSLTSPRPATGTRRRAPSAGPGGRTHRRQGPALPAGTRVSVALCWTSPLRRRRGPGTTPSGGDALDGSDYRYGRGAIVGTRGRRYRRMLSPMRTSSGTSRRSAPA